MAQWDNTQPVFDGMKIPEWAMVDPLQQVAENMARQEQHQAQMRQAQLAEQRQQMDIEARMQQQQMQQGIAEYVRGNPGATPDQVYGAVQKGALAGGDIATWLNIAKQMHEQNMTKERVKREQERQEASANNSSLSTMARLQGINPQLAYNYILSAGLADDYGITPNSLVKKETPKKEKEVKRSSYVAYDPITKRNIIVNQNNPEVSARLDAGLLLPKKSESEIQMAELMSQPPKEEGPGLLARLGAWWNGEGRQDAQTVQEPQGKQSLVEARALLAGKQPGQKPQGKQNLVEARALLAGKQPGQKPVNGKKKIAVEVPD